MVQLLSKIKYVLIPNNPSVAASDIQFVRDGMQVVAEYIKKKKEARQVHVAESVSTTSTTNNSNSNNNNSNNRNTTGDHVNPPKDGGSPNDSGVTATVDISVSILQQGIKLTSSVLPTSSIISTGTAPQSTTMDVSNSFLPVLPTTASSASSSKGVSELEEVDISQLHISLQFLTNIQKNGQPSALSASIVTRGDFAAGVRNIWHCVPYLTLPASEEKKIDVGSIIKRPIFIVASMASISVYVFAYYICVILYLYFYLTF